MKEEGKYPVPQNLPEGSHIIYPESGGMIIKGANGRNLPGTIIPKRISSSEEGRSLAMRRIETTKVKMRNRILEAAQLEFERMKDGDFKIPNIKGITDVFSTAAAMLFVDVVLNKKAYPRDRLATFKELGKMVEVLEDEQKAVPPSPIPESMLHNATKIILAIEYAKEHPDELSPSRDAEVIDITPDKQWI